MVDQAFQLQGGIDFQAIAKDPAFQSFSPDDKAAYLQQAVLPQAFPEFKSMAPDQQQQYIQHEVMPKLAPSPVASLSHNPLSAFPDNYTSPQVAQMQAQTARMPLPAMPKFEATSIGRRHYTPLESAGNFLAGMAGGVQKGIFPVENGGQYSYDPAGRAGENLTELPTSLAAQMLGLATTGGAYNAAVGGIGAMDRNRQAQDQAIRSQDWATLRRLQNTEAPAVLSNTAAAYAMSKLPGHMGGSLPLQMGTGAGLGYGMDVGNNMLGNYAQTGKVDWSNPQNYMPGMGTLLGSVLPAGLHFAPHVGEVFNGGNNQPISIPAAMRSAPVEAPPAPPGALQAHATYQAPEVIPNRIQQPNRIVPAETKTIQQARAESRAHSKALREQQAAEYQAQIHAVVDHAMSMDEYDRANFLQAAKKIAKDNKHQDHQNMRAVLRAYSERAKAEVAAAKQQNARQAEAQQQQNARVKNSVDSLVKPTLTAEERARQQAAYNEIFGRVSGIKKPENNIPAMKAKVSTQKSVTRALETLAGDVRSGKIKATEDEITQLVNHHQVLSGRVAAKAEVDAAGRFVGKVRKSAAERAAMPEKTGAQKGVKKGKAQQQQGEQPAQGPEAEQQPETPGAQPEEKTVEDILTTPQMARVIAARAKLKRIMAEVRRKYGVKDDSSQIDTPEREALREEIATDLYGEGAKTKEGRLDIVMGPPGAGKSSVIVKGLVEKHGSIVLDSDLVKERLQPEYGDGIGAGAVHEESGDVLDKRLVPRTLLNNDNTVLSIVGKNINKVRTYIDYYRRNGFEINLHYVDITPEESVRRTYARFAGSEKRFVDPDYVLSVGLNPKHTFATLVEEGNIHEYSEYDNNVPEGQPARLVRQGQGSSLRPENLGELQRGEPGTDRPSAGEDASSPKSTGPPAEESQVANKGLDYAGLKAHANYEQALDKLSPKQQVLLGKVGRQFEDGQKAQLQEYAADEHTTDPALKTVSPYEFGISKAGDIYFRAYNDDLQPHTYRADRLVDVTSVKLKAYKGKYARAGAEPGTYRPYDSVKAHVEQHMEALEAGDLSDREKASMRKYINKLDPQERAKLENDLGCTLPGGQ